MSPPTVDRSEAVPREDCGGILEREDHQSAVDRQAQAMALADSAPLKYNAQKIDMAKGLLASGLERLSA
jgi:hypothetical protein